MNPRTGNQPDPRSQRALADERRQQLAKVVVEQDYTCAECTATISSLPTRTAGVRRAAASWDGRRFVALCSRCSTRRQKAAQ